MIASAPRGISPNCDDTSLCSTPVSVLLNAAREIIEIRRFESLITEEMHDAIERKYAAKPQD
jgi:hypothetical protein